tara:strand:- start:1464 stop:1877 length:414 start_codon:yes stop_codon:yes gene_type:complete
MDSVCYCRSKLPKEDEEMITLRKERDNMKICIIELSKYYDAKNDKTPEQHAFVRHVCRKKTYLNLKIAVKQMQRDIKRMPVAQVQWDVVDRKGRKLSDMLEEAENFEDEFTQVFKELCEELLVRTNELVKAIELLKE